MNQSKFAERQHVRIKREGCDSPSNVTPPKDIRGKTGTISTISWRCTAGVDRYDYTIAVDDKFYVIDECWLESTS